MIWHLDFDIGHFGCGRRPALGVLPGDDPLEGLEKDIRVARVVNVRNSA